MMAYKCDRCGQYYDEPLKPKRWGERIGFLRVSDDEFENYINYNLCGKCVKELITFLGDKEVLELLEDENEAK